MKKKPNQLLSVFLILSALTLIAVSCKKDESNNNTSVQAPVVTTAAATSIAATSAISGGNVVSDSGSAVTARGVCWSTSPNPTIAGSKTTDGTGLGSFTSNLTGLTANTTYYLRSYATNAKGTGYGNVDTFTTQPVSNFMVQTTAISHITTTKAVSGGIITSDNGAIITARGVCWSTNANPSLTDNHTTDSLGTGTYTSNVTGLTTNTIYHVRAYASNNTVTIYGNDLSFTTLTVFICGSTLTINHIAGAVAPESKTITYGTVGNIAGEASKCWITSNLGADHQAATVDDSTEASAGWYWKFNRKQGYKHHYQTVTPDWFIQLPYGGEVDWQANQDPCNLELGSGWRIPTKSEWGNIDSIGNWTDWNGPWNSDLKLHAAGFLENIVGSLQERGSFGYYWPSTHLYGTAYIFVFGEQISMIGLLDNKNLGCNIRCLRD